MGKLSLSMLLIVMLSGGCKSGKTVHLVESPYVDRQTGAVKEDPFDKRSSWWDLLFSESEPHESAARFNLGELNSTTAGNRR